MAEPEFLVPEHRSRLLEGMARAVAGKGYAATTIADIVRDVLGSSVSVHRNHERADPADVRVRFGKAVLQLGWQPRGSIYTAVYDIATALAAGRLHDTPETYTLQWYRHLRACEQALRSGTDTSPNRVVH